MTMILAPLPAKAGGRKAKPQAPAADQRKGEIAEETGQEAAPAGEA